MPAYLKRARAVEDAILTVAQVVSPVGGLFAAMQSFGVTTAEAAAMMGTVPPKPQRKPPFNPVPPSKRPGGEAYEPECLYCRALVRGDRCGNCGAPRMRTR